LLDITFGSLKRPQEAPCFATACFRRFSFYEWFFLFSRDGVHLISVIDVLLFPLLFTKSPFSPPFPIAFSSSFRYLGPNCFLSVCSSCPIRIFALNSDRVSNGYHSPFSSPPPPRSPLIPSPHIPFFHGTLSQLSVNDPLPLRFPSDCLRLFLISTV